MADRDSKKSSVKYGGYYSSYRDSYDTDDYYDYYDDWSYYSRNRRKTYSSSWWDKGTKTTGTGGTMSSTTTRTSSYSGFSWSGALGFGSSYSSYKKLSDTEVDRFTQITNKALNLTREFISILALPFKVRIAFAHDCFEEGNSNYKTRLLFLPTKILDRAEDKSDETIINTTVGLGLHETAHLMYSELSIVEGFFNKHCPPEFNKIVKFIFNLIEDERVEDLLLKGRPGYSTFINTAREFRVEEITNNPNAINSLFDWVGKGSDFNTMKSILLNIIYAIRFPGLIEESVVTTHSKLFNEIRKDLLKQPARTMDSCNLALSIVNKLSSYLEEVLEGTVIKTCAVSKTSSNMTDSITSLYTIDLLYGSDKSLDDSKISEKISKMMKYQVSEATKDSSFRINLKVAIGAAEFGTNKKSIFFKNEPSDSGLYRKIKTKISKYVPQIKNKIKNIDKNSTFNIFGCRSGLLDTTKIVEAIQGVPQVYYRTGKISTNKTTVCILVDESGSMCHSVDGGYIKPGTEDYSIYGGGCRITRADVAREAAILLNEALNIPGVDLYIYGHSADQKSIDTTELYVYCEPGYKNIQSMTSIQARCENRDGTAIYEVAKRVRKFTDSQVLLFVISDGYPSANDYRGDSAIIDTAAKVKTVEGMGFDVVQVTISGDLPESTVKQMFNKCIRLDRDLTELPQKLGQVIKKSVLSDKQSTITF